jgi:succinate-semialdehyde dehydrogenase / glutarate-semialdehyde dehydrogenase
MSTPAAPHMIGLRNPRTGQPDGAIRSNTPAELTASSARLHQAQPGWAALTPSERAVQLLSWKDTLLEHREPIVSALIADTGRKKESNQEFDAFLGALDRWARMGVELLDTNHRFTSTMGFVDIDRAYRPYGVLGVISPWNFPLVLSTIDVIPALMAGCSVMLKPSEITSRFVAPLRATLGAVPALDAVFDIVIGDGLVGAQMIEDGLVDAVCFTGSVQTGRKVAAMAAAAFIPAFLELGGKDAAIVCEGADLDLASSALLWGSTSNAGQACQSIERIYVQRSVAAPFVELLSAKASNVGLCFPEIDQPGLGPIIAERQVAIIEAHLADAQAKGARVTAGSRAVEYFGGGAWVRATVLTGVTHDMAIMTDETFGPFLPVMTFDTIDEAIALANESRFGLSAAVFAETESAGIAIARQLDAGAVSINDSTLTAFLWEGEKHSFKASGMGGSRMGAAGLLRFVRSQALLIKTNGPTRNPWWYPEQPEELHH